MAAEDHDAVMMESLASLGPIGGNDFFITEDDEALKMLSEGNMLDDSDPHENAFGIDPLGVKCEFEGNVSGGDETQRKQRAIWSHPRYPALINAFFDVRCVAESPKRKEELLKERKIALATVSGPEVPQMRETLGLGKADLPDMELNKFMEEYIAHLQGLKIEFEAIYSECQEDVKVLERELQEITSGKSGGGREEVAAQARSDGYKFDSALHERRLHGQLNRSYADAIINLRNEFAKKQKKGKLPKSATTVLKRWWQGHITWPYPSDEDKRMLGGKTNLTPTQINNWFINQRKRHWHKLFPKGIPATAEEAKEFFKKQGCTSRTADDPDTDED